MADKSRNQKRPSIYMNPPLERVTAARRDGQSLSSRLADIAERYEFLRGPAPDLTEGERHILANTLSGSRVDPLLIKYLDREIEDSDAGDPAECRSLAERVSQMTMAERVAMIDDQGF